LSEFTRDKVEPHDDDSVTVTLGMTSTDATKKLWPHSFLIQQIITVGQTLKMDFRVHNRDTTPFTFEAALHSYFFVGNIQQTQVIGLSGVEYLDRVRSLSRFTETQEPIRFTGEFDRTYLNTESAVTIVDPVLNRNIVIRKTGSRSTVVWNPWLDKAKAMADFDDDGWRNMLCIETANAGENAIELQPGESHSMTAEISVVNDE
jgi:D-hexose-6-phosphate mutarotase